MARVLILYASVEGQTARIAARMAQRLQSRGHAVVVADARSGGDPEAYDAVIVGASVHYGHHPGWLRAALRARGAAFDRRPNAFFSVSLSADGPGANLPAARRYVARFLRRARWQPAQVATFGGALRYSIYGPLKRFVVRLFVRIAGGDTDTSRDYEYTDWAAVARFADAFAERLAPAGAAPTA